MSEQVKIFSGKRLLALGVLWAGLFVGVPAMPGPALAAPASGGDPVGGGRGFRGAGEDVMTRSSGG